MVYLGRKYTMSKITRRRRGLWAAGQWWSNAWIRMMGGGARRFPFQITQNVVLIFLLLLALTSAVIRPPLEHPKKLSTTSFQQRKHLLRVDRRSLTSSRYRPSTLSHTTHCFFNQLCSCKVLLRRSGHGESTSVDDFGNIDYYDGFPVRDLMNGGYSSISSSGEETTEVYQGQFGRVSSTRSDNDASSTENTNKVNATSHARVSSSERLPKPSRLKGTGRGSKRGRGRMRGSFFDRMGKHVQDVSCVGVPFTTIPGMRISKYFYPREYYSSDFL